jgi:hypothetical protein
MLMARRMPSLFLLRQGLCKNILQKKEIYDILSIERQKTQIHEHFMGSSGKTELYRDQEQVVSKALARAVDYWGISNKQLGDYCGLSEATVSRLKHGNYTLSYASKPWQLGVMVLRIFRGLDAYMGGHKENERAWLSAYNHALGGVPLALMANPEGLTHVVQYVDYMRGQ